jgi:hypothetical protein
MLSGGKEFWGVSSDVPPLPEPIAPVATTGPPSRLAADEPDDFPRPVRDWSDVWRPRDRESVEPPSHGYE